MTNSFDNTTLDDFSDDHSEQQATATDISDFHPLPEGSKLGPFTSLAYIGRGGMGCVYKAWDDEDHCYVAIKTLTSLHSNYLVNLKQEFRQLTNMYHDNIVSIEELRVDETYDGQSVLYIVMEYIEGVDLYHYVRENLPVGEQIDEAGWQRLRHTLSQLIDAISALHKHGLLHCDLKPSNIMVDQSDKVKVLDFGIVQPIIAHSNPSKKGIFGTRAYMSPEQFKGEAVSEASDWYALGIVLYELLTGIVPKRNLNYTVELKERFVGHTKQFDDLCRQLLEDDVSLRPNEALIRRLLLTQSEASRFDGFQPVKMVGQTEILHTLNEVFIQWQQKAPLCAVIDGEAGIGKTTVVEAFLTQLSQNNQTIVLQGRCNAAEQIPYKALDGVIDRLYKHLKQLKTQLEPMLEGINIALAAQLFTVLNGLISDQNTSQNKNNSQNSDSDFSVKLSSAEQRLMAFGELKKLLFVLCQIQPIVIFIDDVHWGDIDSIQLLAELFSPPQPVPLMLIMTCRTAMLDGEFMSAWQKKSEYLLHVKHIQAHVGALDHEQTCELVRQHLPKDASSQMVSRIAEQSQCQPFFASQMAKYCVHQNTQGLGVQSADDISVDVTVDNPNEQNQLLVSIPDVVNLRLGQVSTGAKTVLEFVAVASRPLSQKLVLQAANITEQGRALLSKLQAMSLLRVYGGRPGMLVELYHDRFRHGIIGLIDESRIKTIHLTWAQVLAEHLPEPDLLSHHYFHGGKVSVAADYALSAGFVAQKALAFEQANNHFGNALSWGDWDDNKQIEIISAQADACFNAGLSQQAAALYGQVTALSEGLALTFEDTNLWRSRYIECLFISGDIDKGLKALVAGMSSLGLKYAGSVTHAGLMFVKNLLGLLIRGTNFKPQTVDEGTLDKKSDQILTLAIKRADLCWSAGKGLMYILPLQGADLMLRSLRFSLITGDPHRIGRGLASMGAGMFSQIKPLIGVGQKYLHQAQALAQTHQDGYLEGVTLAWQSFACFYSGNWPQMNALADKAMSVLSEKTIATPWEKLLADGLSLHATYMMGNLPLTIERANASIINAQRRGDLPVCVLLEQYLSFCLVLQGKFDQGVSKMDWIEQNWSEVFNVQLFYNELWRSVVAIQTQDIGRAQGILLALIPLVKQHGLHRSALSRIDLAIAEARVSLQVQGDCLLRSPAKIAIALEKESRTECMAHAGVIRAAVAYQQGNTAQCIDYLRATIENFAQSQLNLHVINVKHRIALLTDDQALLAQTTQQLEFQGIEQIAACCDVFTPGFN